MVDVVGTLKSVKECIDGAVCQMQALANLRELTLSKLPAYAQAISGLEVAVDTLDAVFVDGIPEKHTVRFSQLRLLEIDLVTFKKTLDKCVDWHKSMIFLGWFPPTGVHADDNPANKVLLLPESLNTSVIADPCNISLATSSSSSPLVHVTSCSGILQYVAHFKRVFRVTPVILEQEVDVAFEKIRPLLQEAVSLQRDILGSAIEIQHPVLRLAWIASRGQNDLNSSDLSVTALIESLYLLLQKEEGGVIVREDYCRDMIANFVRYLDGLAGSKPDQKISLAEIKQFPVTTENSFNVKALLGLKQQPDEESRITVDLNLLSSSTRGPVKVYHSSPVEIPHCEGYGCNWPSKVVGSFVVPDWIGPATECSKTKFLVGVEVRCYAADQGFGGTGHAQVRFQVQDEMAVPAFSVWRDRVLDGNYSFVIGPDKVKVGDTVKIWACCPPWNAWTLSVSGLDVQAKFA